MCNLTKIKTREQWWNTSDHIYHRYKHNEEHILDIFIEYSPWAFIDTVYQEMNYANKN